MTAFSEESHRRLSRCLSVDLEVTVRERRIRAFAGVRWDTGESFLFPGAGNRLPQSLAKLDSVDFLRRRFGPGENGAASIYIHPTEATTQSVSSPSSGPVGVRSSGGGWDPLPFALGPPFPARLPARGTVSGECRGRVGPAGGVRYRHSKLEVVGDTTDYFQKEPGVGLRVFDGGVCRLDLELVVFRRDIGEKLAQIHEALRAYTPDEEGAGHRVLRDTEPLKGVGCIPAGQGGKGGALSRSLSFGDQEERAG